MSDRPAGDAHNFGRHVTVGDLRVHKPRALLWEWLFLCAQSPLRLALDGAEPNAFDFLGDLAFSDPFARDGGDVDRVTLDPLPTLSSDARRDLARIVGRSLALFSWFGVTDLHWENLALGVDRAARIVFSPLDIEMILGDFARPTETKLLPDADPEYAGVCQHAAGVRRVLPFVGKPMAAGDLVAMASAYRSTLRVLDRHAQDFAQVFAQLQGLTETPIRVCLRSTGDYVAAPSVPPWPPLLEAESVQLARGDIPYFFRLIGNRGIHSFGDATLTKIETLPMRGDVPRLQPLLPIAKDLRSPNRKKLREEGLFTLIGAFDHPSMSGRHEADGLAITFAKRTLRVDLDDGEVLESKRAMQAFVSSVYQPCTCGEVRSVLVPQVTACKAPPR
jgi:hypothetical protein